MNDVNDFSYSIQHRQVQNQINSRTTYFSIFLESEYTFRTSHLLVKFNFQFVVSFTDFLVFNIFDYNSSFYNLIFYIATTSKLYFSEK